MFSLCLSCQSKLYTIPHHPTPHTKTFSIVWKNCTSLKSFEFRKVKHAHTHHKTLTLIHQISFFVNHRLAVKVCRKLSTYKSNQLKV